VDCRHALSLMDGYLDTELDLMTQLEVERHLASCRSCHGACQRRRALSAVLGTETPCHPAPPAVAHAIGAALDAIDAESGAGRRRAPRWFQLAAAVAFAALLGSGAGYWVAGASRDELLTQEVVASHVRAQMVPGRVTDVSSSDSHTVKPWFNGKLDFAPPVLDLTGEGFALVGGRLDYLGGRTVAALVYRHRQHLIHLFVWPAVHRPNRARQVIARQGYQVIHWSDAGMHYWAVSDLNANDLRAFGELVRDRTTAARLQPTISPGG
jgi:anti-sigma factor RsiW